MLRRPFLSKPQLGYLLNNDLLPFPFYIIIPGSDRSTLFFRSNPLCPCSSGGTGGLADSHSIARQHSWRCGKLVSRPLSSSLPGSQLVLFQTGPNRKNAALVSTLWHLVTPFLLAPPWWRCAHLYSRGDEGEFPIVHYPGRSWENFALHSCVLSRRVADSFP